jgi:hypothetical protein
MFVFLLYTTLSNEDTSKLVNKQANMSACGRFILSVTKFIEKKIIGLLGRGAIVINGAQFKRKYTEVVNTYLLSMKI